MFYGSDILTFCARLVCGENRSVHKLQHVQGLTYTEYTQLSAA